MNGTNISPEQMTEYFKSIVELERDCYTQSRFINEISQQINNLGRSTSRKKPIEPIPPHDGDKYGLLTENIGILAMAGVGGGAILGILIFVVSSIVSENPLGIIQSFFIAAVISVGVGLIVLKTSSNKKSINEWDKYQREKEQYRHELLQYDDYVKQEIARVRREEKQRDFLQHELDQLVEKNRKSKDILKQLYNMDVVFSKYKYFIAIASFYEYFSSGRCTALEGHEGAYNIFETEVRLDKISTQINHVIAQLEQIKTNQYVIYEAIQESNSTLHSLLKSCGDISSQVYKIEAQGEELNSRIAQLEANSALQLYISELNLREQRYINLLR